MTPTTKPPRLVPNTDDIESGAGGLRLRGGDEASDVRGVGADGDPRIVFFFPRLKTLFGGTPS
jgi:hypothetical protein